MLTSSGTAALQLSLRNTQSLMNQSMERLATGYRINRGSDDPAGLISSERLRALLAGLDAESRSLQRTSQVVDTADAALGEVSGLLSEANALALANANTAGLTPEERAANQLQIDSILSSVNRIASTTSFNGDPLLDGTAQVDAAGQMLNIDSVRTGDLGSVTIDGMTYSVADAASGGSLSTVDGVSGGAQQAIAVAIDQVSSMRGSMGAFSRYAVDGRLSNIEVARENLAAAESAIRETDYAGEITNLMALETGYKAAVAAMDILNRTNLVDLLA